MLCDCSLESWKRTLRFEYAFDGYVEGPDALASFIFREDSKFGLSNGNVTFTGDTYFSPQRDAFFAEEAGISTTLTRSNRAFSASSRGVGFLGYRGTITTEFDVVFGEYLNVNVDLDTQASGRFFPGESTSDFSSTATLSRVLAFDAEGNPVSLIFQSADPTVDLSGVEIVNEFSAPAVVPLPAGLPLLLAGIAAFAFLRRR